jgi:DNA replication initiation complex subunit (GINS family)
VFFSYRHLTAPSVPRLTPQLRILQLHNVIEGMKEQMVRLENYCEERKQRKISAPTSNAATNSSCASAGAEDEPASDGADEEDAEADLLEETLPANIMRGRANVMGAIFHT